MEKYTLDKDLQMVCIRAKSFPNGIMEAVEKLLQIDPSIPNRTSYGIPHSSNNGILYTGKSRLPRRLAR